MSTFELPLRATYFVGGMWTARKTTGLKGPEYHLWLKNWQALYGVENLVIAPGYNKNKEE